MERKRHFKLYKSGKLWCTAAIVTIALGITGISQTAYADNINAQATISKLVSPSTSEQYAAQLQINNRVPQDTTTQNNQFSANRGNLDSYSLNESQNGQVEVQASGWHVSGQSNKDPYRYMIVFDNTQGREVNRQKIAPQTRTDVERVYSNVTNSANSGFNTTITIPKSAASHSISLISRYSSDPNNGEGNHVDYWFGPLYIDQNNRASLDNLSVQNDKLHVAGWHATNQAAGMNYHTIIVFDQSTGREISRQLISQVSRDDVAKVFPTISNAKKSGFAADFNLQSAMISDQIQIISRWSATADANSNYVDYWFPAKRFFNDTGNYASLDSISAQSTGINVIGWHASNQAFGKNYHYLILLDQSTGKEISRKLITSPTNRPDVAKVYQNVIDAGKSGFNVNFNLTPLQENHKLQLVSRWTTDPAGNGINTTDYWFKTIDPSINIGNLDSANRLGKNLTVNGWNASDASIFKPYHTLILFDTTNNSEISRQTVQNTIRNDVAKAFPAISSATHSGFTGTFANVSFKKGHSYSLISRYSGGSDANSNYVDHWFNLFSIPTNGVRVDWNGNTIRNMNQLPLTMGQYINYDNSYGTSLNPAFTRYDDSERYSTTEGYTKLQLEELNELGVNWVNDILRKNGLKPITASQQVLEYFHHRTFPDDLQKFNDEHASDSNSFGFVYAIMASPAGIMNFTDFDRFPTMLSSAIALYDTIHNVQNDIISTVKIYGSENLNINFIYNFNGLAISYNTGLPAGVAQDPYIVFSMPNGDIKHPLQPVGIVDAIRDAQNGN